MTVLDSGGRIPPYPRRPQAPIRPLITAEEAYPALEHAVIEARQSIWLAYRVFEPWMVLTSRAAKHEAGDWIGLLRDKLREGVQVRILLSDFDAVGADRLHERCWRCLRALAPLWEHGDFAALPALHMAGAGWLWRVLLWPAGVLRLAQVIRGLNRLPQEERHSRLAAMPGLWPGLRVGPEGRLTIWPGRTPSLYPATYHQKFAVIDGHFALVGGLDVNARRFDDLQHRRPGSDTWADVAVSTEGPIAADLARHFAECWTREAPRQRRRAERMVSHAPPRISLPPLPGPEHDPALPEQHRDETGAEAAQAITAAASASAMTRSDRRARDPGRPLGKVAGQPPPEGAAAVPTRAEQAMEERVVEDRAAGRGPAPRAPEDVAPAADPVRGGSAQVIRTVTGQPSGRGLLRLAPRTMADEIAQAHLQLIGQAEQLIYLETQFLRARGMVDALVSAGRRNPGLGLIVVIPAAPMEVAFEGRQTFADRAGEYLQTLAVRRLRRAFGIRCVLIAPLRPVPHWPSQPDAEARAVAHGAEIIFVHSKAMTVDDNAAIVGSANMNGRSLRWDVEVALLMEGGSGPPALRRRLFEHWLPCDAGPEAFALETAVAEWRRIAIEEVGRPPAQRQSFLAPYAVRRAARFARAAPGIPEDFL